MSDIEKIHREPLLRCYVDNMVEYLLRNNATLITGDTKDQYKNQQVKERMTQFIENFVKDHVRNNMKVP